MTCCNHACKLEAAQSWEDHSLDTNPEITIMEPGGKGYAENDSVDRFISQLLIANNGEVPASTVNSVGKEHGFTKEQLSRGRMRLGIASQKRQIVEWYWQLPRVNSVLLDELNELRKRLAAEDAANA